MALNTHMRRKGLARNLHPGTRRHAIEPAIDEMQLLWQPPFTCVVRFPSFHLKMFKFGSEIHMDDGSIRSAELGSLMLILGIADPTFRGKPVG